MLAEYLGLNTPNTYQGAPCTTLDFKTDVDVFYPRAGALNAIDTMKAKEYCNGCPFQAQCLTDALAEEAANSHGDRFGVRGGLSAKERAQLVANQATAA